MKYEKFDKDGVPYIRICVSEHEVVERPMVDADAELFKDGDVYERNDPPVERASTGAAVTEPTPAEPYKDG